MLMRKIWSFIWYKNLDKFEVSQCCEKVITTCPFNYFPLFCFVQRQTRKWELQNKKINIIRVLDNIIINSTIVDLFHIIYVIVYFVGFLHFMCMKILLNDTFKCQACRCHSISQLLYIVIMLASQKRKLQENKY